MADKKISALTAASTPLAGTEVLPIVQSSATKQVSIANITAGRDVTATSFAGGNIKISGNTVSSTDTNGNIVYSPNGTGKNGFGTSAPPSLVTIKGSGTYAGGYNADDFLILDPSGLNNAQYGFYINQFFAASTVGALFTVGVGDTNNHTYQLAFATAGSEAFRLTRSQYMLVGYTSSNGSYRLQVNSQIFATSSTIATSDGRYKENVTDLTDCLNIVKSLRPVSFDWKQHAIHNFDTENTTVGFIAQDVQSVLADKPYVNSIVKSNKIEETNEEFLGIAEGNLIAILTKALQETVAKIEILESKVATLESKA